MRNDVFVVHVCKNSTLKGTYNKETKEYIEHSDYCNNCWIDVDKTNATTYPPTWKYCPECEKKGFKNPKTRNATKTPEQIEAFKQRMKQARMLKHAND